MTTPLNPDTIERLARQRAGRKMGYYIHALVFAAFNTGPAVLALANGRLWLMGTFFGWGLGLLIHGTAVFVLPDGRDWRERPVQREREHLLRKETTLTWPACSPRW